MGQLTHSQAKAVAWFIHDALRPDWGEEGVLAALGEARDKAPADDVVIAAIVAARTPANRTPGVIPLPGPHWAHTAVRRAPVADPGTARGNTCATCYLDRDKCRARWASDHEFESIAEAMARRVRKAEANRGRLHQPAVVKGRPVDNVELP